MVIAYKDRLARFGYDLIERIIEDYSQGKIKVINEKKSKEAQEELIEDVLQVMNVFVAKMNGMRKYEKKQRTSRRVNGKYIKKYQILSY